MAVEGRGGGGGHETGGAGGQRGGGREARRLPQEHLQDVVDHVAGPAAPLRKVVFGEEAERLAVHLELLHVDLLEVELPLAVLEELADVFPAPSPGVGREATWSNRVMSSFVSSYLRLYPV